MPPPAARGRSRTGVACGFGRGSSLAGLARIAGNSAAPCRPATADLRLDPGPNPRRTAARDFCHGLLAIFWGAHAACLDATTEGFARREELGQKVHPRTPGILPRPCFLKMADDYSIVPLCQSVQACP